jgi:hypothetical protein
VPQEPADPRRTGFDRVRAVLARASGPATPEEGAGEAATVAAMIAAHLGSVPVLAARRAIRRRWAVRTAIAGGVLFAGTGAVAAAGGLPRAAQSTVARAAAHVGVDLPDPGAPVHPSAQASVITSITSVATGATVPPTDRAPTSSTTTTAAPAGDASATTPSTDVVDAGPPTASPATSVPVGPDLDGPAKRGLCTAWDAHQRNPQTAPPGQAFDVLEAAAVAAGQSVADFCAPVLAETADTTDTQPRPSDSHGPGTSAEPVQPPHPTHPVHPTQPVRPTHPTQPPRPTHPATPVKRGGGPDDTTP